VKSYQAICLDTEHCTVGFVLASFSNLAIYFVVGFASSCCGSYFNGYFFNGLGDGENTAIIAVF
jgi:hypothetical protein